MELPNLDLIVDTFIRIRNPNQDAYISQLREELLPEIRKLQKERGIIWYGFLIHDHGNLAGRVPSTDHSPYIHLRLGLPDGSDIDAFIQRLPQHFQKPQKTSLADISGIDVSIMKNQSWAYAWKMHGEASEWVMRMLEAHAEDANIHIQQIIQFMHFLTNPFMIGGRCLCLPTGFLQF